MERNIIQIRGGTMYVHVDGTSNVGKFCEQFEKEHPNAKRFYGNLNRDCTRYTTIYEIHGLSPKSRRKCNYSTLYARYVEISDDDERYANFKCFRS